MKTIILLRHGKSAWDDPDLSDHDRPLAPRGARAATLVGRFMKDHAIVPDLILCSTARRAVDTLRLATAQLDRSPPVDYDAGLYLTGADALMHRLKAVPDDIGAVMLLGHNPDLHDLARALVSSGDKTALRTLGDKFPTAALAVIECPIGHWGDLRRGAGHLDRLVLPKKLQRHASSAKS